MDFDIGTLIYFFAIAIFLYRSFTKKKKEGQRRPARTESAQPTNERRPSFEELLKEFTGIEEEKEPVLETYPKKPEEPKAEKVEDDGHKTPERSSAKDRGLEKRAEQKRLYGDPIELIDDEIEDDIDYREMFEDYTGARKAFVASQVFQRKY